MRYEVDGIEVEELEMEELVLEAPCFEPRASYDDGLREGFRILGTEEAA